MLNALHKVVKLMVFPCEFQLEDLPAKTPVHSPPAGLTFACPLAAFGASSLAWGFVFRGMGVNNASIRAGVAGHLRVCPQHGRELV